MLVYKSIKRDFIRDVNDEVIAKIIDDEVYRHLHFHTSKNEYHSWENSMLFMARAINDTSIPDDSGIAIEYNIPQTSKRVDFIISGYDAEGAAHADIVELKQWSSIKAVTDMDGIVKAQVGGGTRYLPHPSYQALSYATVLRNFNEVVDSGEVTLHPCAYLHNYEHKKDDPLFDPHYSEYLEAAPAFVIGDLKELRRFIERHIEIGDNARILEDIDAGKLRPSKSLQDALVGMLRNNPEFVLIDDQKVVYERALKYARQTAEDGRKRVYVVKGGPGTGKSVVAINLLCELTAQGMNVEYVSKNSAPRSVYIEKLRGSYKRLYIDSLFKGSGAFVDKESNSFDSLIIDEAHRLNERSGLYGNIGENQIKEIINAGKFSVFFIDEEQRVTLKDIGSIKGIKAYAEYYNAHVDEDELVSQFRCNGSDGYLAWLDNVLEIHPTANYDLDGIDFDFRVVDSPTELYELIKAKNVNNKARLLAGYCWEWPSKNRRNPQFFDIVIDEFGMSWNLDGQLFAIDPDSIETIGCIHTTQGLEFDYVGVIIGNDMKYEDGHIVTDFTKRAKTDQSLRGIKSLAKENPEEAYRRADEIIKNTYRTLMTRGMKGCYVYCTNPGLQKYLSERSSAYILE